MFSSSSYNRFGDRGHGRSRGGFSAISRGNGQGRRPTAAKNSKCPSPPLGPILNTIQYSEVEAAKVSFNDARIANVKYIASYNWLKADEPTIVTPGKPPKWTPTATPTRLEEDDPKGTYFRDPNAAYFPSYPMEPVVRSIFEACPNFNGLEVDLFACGSTLGNLLRFVRNAESDKPFRFLVEVVGKTVFLIRRERSPKEMIPELRGYGHSFPEANTTWDPDVRKSDTHQRIISYQLGHLHTFIRFEADGYLADKVPAKTTYPTPVNRVVNEDAFVSAFTGNTINMHKPKTSNILKVTQGQKSVPQSAIFDLKTRSIKKKLYDTTVADQIPRLWIRQIPFFILAYHESGLFRSENVTVRDIRSDIVRWESDHRDDVRKLIGLIEKIIDVVMATPGRKMEVRYQHGLGLELREQAEGVATVLPDDLAARWATHGDRAGPHGRAVSRHSIDDLAGREIDAGEEGVVLDSSDDASDDDEYDCCEEKDYTACSADSCGYCGRCSY